MSRTELFVRKQPGGVYAVEDSANTTGARFYVHSSGSASTSAGRNPDNPITTVDAAIGLCTASKGDIIHVMPGHTETLASAASWAVDVAGIKIVGPSFGPLPVININTEHTVAAPILISAAGCTIENLRFMGYNAGGSKDAIEISASNTTIKGCEFRETSTDKELGIGAGYGIITILDSSAAIDGTNIINCDCRGLAGNDEAFLSVTDGSNGATNVTIDGCYIVGTFADDTIQADAGTNVNTPWKITNSVIGNLGGNNVAITIDAGAAFFMDTLTVFGAGSTTAPIVGYNASYMGRVWSCEPGAFGDNGLIGSTTNWGA